MKRVNESSPAQVVSHDGTAIAYWTSGEGSPLLLVHGVTADHTRWRPLLPYLQPHVTVYLMDRRGRGASTDGPDYHLTREFEDVAAVVDAIADSTGRAVDLYGHSFGGLCALGAAALTANLHRLLLYEGWPSTNPAAHALSPAADHLDALLAEGKHEAVVETLFREVVKMSEEELDSFRALPSWPARVAAAHTVPREVRAIREAPFDADWAAKVTTPTLLITGSESQDPATADVETMAAALPRAQIMVLDGHQHVADVLAPEVFAEHVLAFLRGEPS